MKKINVYYKGFDYGNDIGPLIKAFFEECTINIVAYADIEEDNAKELERKRKAGKLYEEPTIVGRVDLTLEDTIDCKMSINGKEASFHIGFDGDTDGVYYNKGVPDRRMYRNNLHRALYRALSEISGKTLPWGTLTGVRPTKQVLDLLLNGKTEDEISDFYEKEYLASASKAGLAIKVAENELKLLDGISFDDTYSLYIGVPFCPSICLYCSFSSYPLKQYAAYVEPYVQALLKEIEACSAMLSDKKLISIYFGGGTPTTLSAEQLQTVIRKVKECFDLTYVREWTVEAGRPDSITEEKLEVLKAEGVTRISINPQSMQQKTLDLVGRRHTVEDIYNAFSLARKCGFDDINMDLIAGLNGETFADFKDTLAKVIELSPDSITVHTLAVKRAARLREKMDEYAASMSHETLSMTEHAVGFLKAAGYEPYYLYRQKNMSDNLENVGYAKPSKEGLYNVLIMEECHTILALGPGASSKLVRNDEMYGGNFLNELEDSEEYVVRKIERVENVKSVKDYIERIDEMIERKKNLFCGDR